MTSAENGAAPALDALLRDGRLAGDWTLDPAKSEIRLRSKSIWGLVSVKGVFGQVSGSGTVSPAGEVHGTITVAAGSVDTKNKKRDEHLRSADFFDVGNYPDITFTVDQIRPAGEGVTVTGSLAVRGRARPVSFGAQVSSFDGGEVWLDGEIEISRADFGLTWNQLGMASMNNTITIHAVFARQ
jgi:polyisoprenoid-binding protein YceI